MHSYRNILSAFVTIIMLSLVPNIALSQCLSGDCEDGKGKYKCDCGYVFEGTFKNGEKVYGTLTKKTLTYVGEFKNDVAHGKGKITYKDGSWYEGYFENNVASGLGVYHYTSGTYYHGYFKADLANGYGVMHYNKGGLYAGYMEADLLSGLGSMKYMDKKDVVESIHFGEFNGDYLNGIGVIKEDHAITFGWAMNGKIKEMYIRVDSTNSVVEVSDFSQPTRVLTIPLDDKSNKQNRTFNAYYTNSVGDSIQLSGNLDTQIFQLSWTQNGEDFVYTYDVKQELIAKWVSTDPKNTVGVDVNGTVYTVNPKALKEGEIVIKSTNFSPNDYP